MATTNTKTTSTKKTATTAPTKTVAPDTNNQAADLEAQIRALQEQLALAQEAINAANAARNAAAPAVAPVVTIAAPNTDVSVVYCSDSMGYAQISNLELHFNKFGEEFIMTRSQFDEFVGKYRSWFDRGVLAVSHKNVDVAAAKGLLTDSEYNMSREKLESIDKMSAAQIEQLWNDNPTKAHRESIVTYYKRKFIEGAPGFDDRSKIDLLNRLTGGGFTREQDELGGRYKIMPTEM